MRNGTDVVCSAIHVLKGAAVRVLRLPTARTTAAIKTSRKARKTKWGGVPWSPHKPEHQGRLTLDVESAPTDVMIEIESLPNSSSYFVPDAPRLPGMLREIEELANSVITADLPFTQLLMSLADAEQRYGQDIYDKRRIRDDDAEVTILVVEDRNAQRDEDDSTGHWNVNCCHNRHFSSTNQLGNIKVLKHNYNAAKKELRLHFEVFPTHE
jgi:hypothetical protein